ncbi:MAG TPA: tetratricopeptide repeat protein, partial [Thermoanaerobaculia bacterium]
MICQVCGAPNELEREYCVKCQSKLLVVSGAPEAYEEEIPQEEGVSMDEHLLERVSVLEEIVKRSAETLKMLLDALNRQEKNGFVAQTGLLALKDLLERKGLLVEEELLDLWETRVDLHMTAMEKRERFLERKERMLGGFSGDRRERFKGLLSDAEFAFYALDPDKAVKVLEEAYRLDKGNADLAFFLGETYFNEGETDRAASMLRAVLAKEPKHFDALVYTGVLENEAGRTDHALEVLKEAVAVKPDAFLPYFTLGALFALKGQLARAETFLKKAVAIDENAQAYSL